MKLAFVYAGGRKDRWEAALNGDAPTEFFYGAVEAARVGHDVRVIDVPAVEGIGSRAYNAAFGFLTPAKLRGEFLAALAARTSEFADCDVVVVTASPLAMAAGILTRLGQIKIPVLAIHCGLVNFDSSLLRTRTTGFALGAQRSHVFATPERDEMARRYTVSPDNLVTNPFGVDVQFWSPGPDPSAGYILSVGNDARRDYATLVRAAEYFDHPVKILTRRELPSPLPKNVECLSGSWHAPSVTDEELRDLYRGALCVVVPLEDAIQPAGQSVTLQAMACGRPVILTKTRGLWTEGFARDASDLLLVPISDPEALAKAIQSLIESVERRDRIGRNARLTVERDGTIDGFAKRLLASCSDLLGPR